jgi:two-component system response regulator CpxR
MSGDTAEKEAPTGSARPILLIDDDVELCALLQEFLARHALRLEVAYDGRRGLGRALGGDHDLLLLDVMMPDLDGFEVLRLIRRQSQVPVIMLTARPTRSPGSDRITGFVPEARS